MVIYRNVAFDRNISAFWTSSVLLNESDVFLKALMTKEGFYLELTVQWLFSHSLSPHHDIQTLYDCLSSVEHQMAKCPYILKKEKMKVQYKKY